mmetsp:Transcript_17525/g.36679  ORF Transcript_17525/g.36679 Transcript_17525/m.36679 type:complete len:296 (-) Transcript_17525:609-1496(-)
MTQSSSGMDLGASSCSAGCGKSGLISERASSAWKGTPSAFFSGSRIRFRPTAVRSSATGIVMTAWAPITQRSPILIFPRIVDPAPMTQSSPMIGWRRSPELPFPVPPRVTPWSIVVRSPMTAVSPITTPCAWSRNSPAWIMAPGCMSTAHISDMRDWSASAVVRDSKSPRFQRQWAMRWTCVAWKPLKNKKGWSSEEETAGSLRVISLRSAQAFWTSDGWRSYASRRSFSTRSSGMFALASFGARIAASASPKVFRSRMYCEMLGPTSAERTTLAASLRIRENMASGMSFASLNS